MKKLIQKILDIQAALDVPKNRWNDFGGYNYRNCEDILQALKPLLIEQDLLQTLTDEVVEINGEAYVRATVIVTDGEDSIKTTALAREQQSRKKMDSAQLTGTASSYARKYALNGMWNIDDVKDPDTGAHNTTQNGSSDKKQKGSDEDKEWLNKTEYQSDEITKQWKNATKGIRAGKFTAEQIINSYQMKDNLKEELRSIEKKAKQQA